MELRVKSAIQSIKHNMYIKYSRYSTSVKCKIPIPTLKSYIYERELHDFSSGKRKYITILIGNTHTAFSLYEAEILFWLKEEVNSVTYKRHCALFFHEVENLVNSY